ncbi:unnamed protein product [Blepharisma stoltei]|uniref:Uncharacterized protein n=1 Tax=Blepharisma stoltei TaxID=1481888 RepID=A0AAU9J9Z6_9CILI|nr:unnamed protein product [Blepharisma stoltei]
MEDKNRENPDQDQEPKGEEELNRIVETKLEIENGKVEEDKAIEIVSESQFDKAENGTTGKGQENNEEIDKDAKTVKTINSIENKETEIPVEESKDSTPKIEPETELSENDPEIIHKIPESLEINNNEEPKADNSLKAVSDYQDSLKEYLPDSLKSHSLEDAIKILTSAYIASLDNSDSFKDSIQTILPPDLKDMTTLDAVQTLATHYARKSSDLIDFRRSLDDPDQLRRLDELLKLAESSDLNSIPQFQAEFSSETKSMNSETTQTETESGIVSSDETHNVYDTLKKLEEENEILENTKREQQEKIESLSELVNDKKSASIEQIKVMVLRMMELIGPQVPEIETVERIIMHMLGMENDEIIGFETKRAEFKGIERKPTKIKKIKNKS